MRYFLTPWFISSLWSPPLWTGWKRNRLSFLLAIKTQSALNISLGVGTMLIISAAVISCSYLLRGHRWFVIMSPLWRGGDILVYLYSFSAQFVSVRSLRLSCRRSNTRRWPNAGPMLAHCPRCWANIIPVLGYRVVFGARLNVGQRYRRRANINPSLVQSIVPLVQPAWRGPTDYGWMDTDQHRRRWSQHITDIGSVLGVHCQTCSSANTRRWVSAGFMLGQCRRQWARTGSALG